MVSYCDRSMSVFRRASSVVNNCFKSLLFLHQTVWSVLIVRKNKVCILWLSIIRQLKILIRVYECAGCSESSLVARPKVRFLMLRLWSEWHQSNTYHAMDKFSRRQTHDIVIFFFFFFFFKKIGPYTPVETICIKIQILVSRKNKKTYFRISSAEITQHAKC